MTPLLIAQISDTHIKPPGTLAYGKVDTAAALVRCVRELNRFTPRPDLVVVSGDLADTPNEAEYVHFNELIAPLAIPFIAVPGNHDSRDLMRAALPGAGYAAPQGPLNIARAVRDVDVIALDSSVPGAAYGLLGDETLRWLDTTLAASRTRPALIFFHHPPFVAGIEHMDVQNLRDAAALADVVRRHRRVRLIATGHIHRATFTQFAGVPTTICPAPNHAVALDLDARLPPSFMIEPPAFHLHAWFPGEGYGTVATHTVPIGDFDGPFPFFGPDGKIL
jgi:3',5'-cyclic AMP phosphodiesterase CpdA